MVVIVSNLVRWQVVQIAVVDVFQKLLQVKAFVLYFLNELLRVWPGLGGVASLYVLLNLFPVTAIQSKSLNKPYVLWLLPATSSNYTFISLINLIVIILMEFIKAERLLTYLLNVFCLQTLIMFIFSLATILFWLKIIIFDITYMVLVFYFWS